MGSGERQDVPTSAVEIQLDKRRMTEYDEPDEDLYSVFVGGKPILSFQTGVAEDVLLSPQTLVNTGDSIELGWGAGEGENWLVRRENVILLTRGAAPSYTMANRLIDERVPLAEIPFSIWCDAVAQFASWVLPLPKRAHEEEEDAIEYDRGSF